MLRTIYNLSGWKAVALGFARVLDIGTTIGNTAQEKVMEREPVDIVRDAWLQVGAAMSQAFHQAEDIYDNQEEYGEAQSPEEESAR